MTEENDRELLEFAAKAAGYKIAQYLGNGCAYVYNNASNHKPKTTFEWMPWHDDGDALRLAVKLELLIHVETCYYVHVMKDQIHVTEHIAKDGSGCLFAATRLAILRAAAEIGKAK